MNWYESDTGTEREEGRRGGEKCRGYIDWPLKFKARYGDRYMSQG